MAWPVFRPEIVRRYAVKPAPLRSYSGLLASNARGMPELSLRSAVAARLEE